MGRPSPRTQGITAEGETFQKFGTQQLSYVDPAKPALGVVERNVGATTKLFFGGVATTPKTPFSQRIQAGITGATKGRPASPTPTTVCECEACKNGTGDCSDKRPCCNAWDVWCELTGECSTTPPPTPPPTGCSCEPCPPERIAIGTCPPKCDDCAEPPPQTCPSCADGYTQLGEFGSILNPCRCSKTDPCNTQCTTCDSDKCKECDAWDIECERCREKNGTCTNPTPPDECGCLPLDWGCKIGCWWDKYGIYVMIVGGLIGLGILLWLLRPLFGIAKNVTGMMKK